jgi:ABC-2 type transport system permease protein
MPLHRSVYLPLRRCAKTALLKSSSSIGDSPLFLIEYVLRLLRTLVMLSIWRTILGHHAAVSSYTLDAVLTYTLISAAFGEQLACRTGLDEALWEGTMAMRAIRPMGMVGQFASETCGRWLPGLCCFSLPLLLSAPLLGVRALPASPAMGAWFVASLALCVAVGLGLEFAFAGLILAADQGVWVVARIRQALTVTLSGALLPLALLPWGLGGVFAWLPFASMASAPLQIYTGTGDPLPLLAIQACWAVLLSILAHWIWTANRERLVSYEG